MIRAANTRHTELLALEILNIFDARMGDQIVSTTLYGDENNLQRKPRENSTYRTDKGSSKRHVTIDQRHHSEARIGLNDLDVHAFLAKEPFARSDEVGRVRVAPAGNRDTKLLGLGFGPVLDQRQTEQKDQQISLPRSSVVCSQSSILPSHYFPASNSRSA